MYYFTNVSSIILLCLRKTNESWFPHDTRFLLNFSKSDSNIDLLFEFSPTSISKYLKCKLHSQKFVKLHAILMNSLDMLTLINRVLKNWPLKQMPSQTFLIMPLQRELSTCFAYIKSITCILKMRYPHPFRSKLKPLEHI
jgi:hypothetical protein